MENDLEQKLHDVTEEIKHYHRLYEDIRRQMLQAQQLIEAYGAENMKLKQFIISKGYEVPDEMRLF